MSRRSTKPDTRADIDLRKCVSEKPPRSFVMKAGAGSGKTTSLIKGLSSVVAIHGDKLRKARQRIACITYTEIAAGEIWQDVGSDPLVHVSTIHSFMWLVAKPFQNDIRSWVSTRIAEKTQTLRETQANFGPRVHQRTKDKTARDLVRLDRQALQIAGVKHFLYGTGSDYPKGILGHDDILKLVPYLISERPLFRALLARQFPFVFVDESQDTTAEVVEALKTVQRESGVDLCIGFFGDPMQRIYATGSGLVEAETDWANIPKPENFRCSSEVLKLANAIRKDGDDLIQVAGERFGPDGVVPIPEGTAQLFILPADDTRDANLIRVRQRMAVLTRDDGWRSGDHDPERVKLLVIVHRMAAKRLGFGNLYAALNDNSPDPFKNGFLDATAWPIRPFISFILPLAEAASSGREFEVMQLLRSHCPLLAKDALHGIDIAKLLRKLRESVSYIAAAIAGSPGATIGNVLKHVHSSELMILDPRLTGYLDTAVAAPAVQTIEDGEDQEEDGEELTKEIAAMDAFLACPANQLLPYRIYISERSPFSTQQGIKGAEFERVLVILDDAESTHFQFSYEKYLGLKNLSDTDRRNIAKGDETTVDRTRRLFYVSCTRALKDLAVVLFTADPVIAKIHIRELSLFADDAIHTQEVFG